MQQAVGVPLLYPKKLNQPVKEKRKGKRPRKMHAQIQKTKPLQIKLRYETTTLHH